MEFTFDVGVWGIVLTGVVAIVFGIALQLIGEARFDYEWVVTGVAAFLAALVASEWIVAWQEFEPVFDGLALVPAVLAGVVVGAIVATAMRLIETRTLRPHTY